MFEGRKYKQEGGYSSRAVRFADIDGGVCTTTYSYSLSHDERFEMARRIAAALNYTTNLSTEQMEGAEPLPSIQTSVLKDQL